MNPIYLGDSSLGVDYMPFICVPFGAMVPVWIIIFIQITSVNKDLK